MYFSAILYFLDLAILEVVFLGLAIFLAASGKRWLMAAICLVGLFYITPRLIVLYVPFWLCIGLLAWAQQRSFLSRFGRATVFIVGILTCLAPLVAFKMFPLEFWVAWNRDVHQIVTMAIPRLELVDSLRPIITAIGLSFAVFRAIDLLVKIYIGKLRDVGVTAVIQYGLFAPVFVSGPIIEFEEIQKPNPVSAKLVLVSALVIGGGIIKISIATFVLREFADISAISSHSPLWRWILILVHPWYFYLNFAGYSDIAIGLAGLYGFVLKPNFNWPFFQQSVQEFWASWHMSLTRWAQRNIFVPLGGYRAEKQYVALLLTMLAIAFWHDVSWNLLLFGLYHSAALIVQRKVAILDRAKGRQPNMAWRPIKIMATYLYVALSFPMLELSFDRLLPVYLSLLGL